MNSEWKPSVAFLGLGVMGFPMAGHLSKAGYPITVYNRTESKAQAWCNSYEGSWAPTPRVATTKADIVFACVGNDDDIRSVCLGDDGAFAGMKAESIFVDHTTASAKVACELAEISRAGDIGFIDAPISGGQRGAEEGILTVMCGGELSHFETVAPVIDTYAKSRQLLGGVGSGQLTKMVNQICIAGLLQGLSEGLHFAVTAGLNAKQVVEVISKGAAQSWQMENRYETMLDDEYNHGFAVEWMRKDLGICLSQAEELGLNLPVTRTVDEYYSEVEKMGGSRWDTSSLYVRLKKNSGIV